MSDHDKKSDSTVEDLKILTLKELLERKKQNLAQSRAFLGQHNNSTKRSKAAAPKGSSHKHRTHKPQGG